MRDTRHIDQRRAVSVGAARTVNTWPRPDVGFTLGRGVTDSLHANKENVKKWSLDFVRWRAGIGAVTTALRLASG